VVRARDHVGEDRLEGIATAATLAELAGLLRQLRRRHARERGDTQLTYRELAARTGWAHGVIGDYFAGKSLPPTDRFDVLVGLLGATAAEQGALATARDRVEESRRRSRPAVQAVTPQELPRDVAAFTGRQVQLAELDRLLSDADTVVLTAVSGTAGVGKTALAVRWAHRVAERFPDGCLYADLRGFSGDTPVRPEQALAAFLRSLGGRTADIPPPGPELAARYRSLLAGRRMLILLDNAHSAEQVRPLLPGTPSCFVLVTSRDMLAGLVARDGARRVVLDRLPGADANTLLHNLIGPRAAAEPDAVTALADRCARLPLALRVAAELAVSRAGATLSEIVDELAGTQRRLDLLDAGGDPETAVRAVFFWSYRRLSVPAARTFRLLGLHPGSEFGAEAVAALTGTSTGEAGDALAELARAHLIETRRAGRYGLHDLLRDYAAELAAAESGAEQAIARLLEHYLDGATAASGPESLAWLDLELPNFVALAGIAAPGYPSRLSAALWRYLDAGGHAGAALVIHGHARDDAERHGDRPALAEALGRLGQVHARLADYPDAIVHMRQSLAIGAELGDLVGQNAMRNSLAHVYSRLGRYPEAIEQLDAALAVERELGNRLGEAKVVGNLGIVHAQLGHYARARDQFTEALRLAQALGDPGRESEALNNLGLVGCWLGDYGTALAQLEQGLGVAAAAGDRPGAGRLHANLGITLSKLDRTAAAGENFALALRIHRETGDRAAEAETLSYLGDLCQRTGRLRAALSRHERALAIAEDIGERSVRAMALNGLGRALAALGEPDSALERHELARAAAVEIGDRLQHARALAGVARCLEETGRARQAHPHWRRAEEIYTELGVPDADEIRARHRVSESLSG
jgi:tetratricopeptide (TPR) repeat protein